MRWNRAAIALIPALLALTLRLYDLSGKPLWLDEVITHKRALLPLSDLVTNSLINKHLPAYFLIARFFDGPMIDEWMLRFPSVIFGTLAAAMVALIASETHSPRAGLCAGTLAAVSPFEVQFSQEARPYMLLSCLVLVALWGLVRIVKASDRSGAATTPKTALHGWAAYAIGTIGALNVLLAAAFWWLAANLAAIVITRGKTAPPGFARRWLLMQAIILISWLPGLLAVALAAHGDPLKGYRWIPPATWNHVRSVVTAVYLFRPSNIATFELLPTVVPGVGAAIVALALWGAWRLRHEPKRLSAILFALATMPIAMAMLSIVHSFWVPRYLLWSTGPMFVLVGIGAATLPRQAFWLAEAGIVMVGIANLVPYYQTETKPRWDLAAAYLAATAQPGDSIVASSEAAADMLGAYGKRYHLDHAIAHGSDVAALAARLPPQGRIWVAFGRTGQVAPGSAEAYRAKWATLGTPASTLPFGDHVVVMRFDRAGSGSSAVDP